MFRAGDGADTIADFAADDTLRLDMMLWGGDDLTEAQVVNLFGTVSGDTLTLRFEGGERLALSGVDDRSELAASVDIVGSRDEAGSDLDQDIRRKIDEAVQGAQDAAEFAGDRRDFLDDISDRLVNDAFDTALGIDFI